MTKLKEVNYEAPIRVLVVEDSHVDRKVLESMLFDPTCCTALVKTSSTLKEGVNNLEEMDFDIVILDLNLPDSKGIESLQLISEKFPEIAIVVNTGAYEETLGLRSLSDGAQDFLVKGKYTAYILNKTLRYALERKRLELELQDTVKKLAEAQAQLVQAEKMKVIGGLASGVAHEVRNPLATIHYGVTFLSQELKPKSGKIKTVIENINEATKRAGLIIKDLLDYASLSKLKLEPTNLNNLIDKSLVLINHEIEKNQVKITKRYDARLPEAMIDPNRIEQVIINVVLNAIQSMPKKGVLNITTRLEKLNDKMDVIPLVLRRNFKPGDEVIVLEAQDNGAGIPEDKLDKIFDPFFTTKRAQGGVGLGLSVCQNIMEIHNGVIFMQNIKGGGAKATLVFPHLKKQKGTRKRKG